MFIPPGSLCYATSFIQTMTSPLASIPALPTGHYLSDSALRFQSVFSSSAIVYPNIIPSYSLSLDLRDLPLRLFSPFPAPFRITHKINVSKVDSSVSVAWNACYNQEGKGLQEHLSLSTLSLIIVILRLFGVYIGQSLWGFKNVVL